MSVEKIRIGLDVAQTCRERAGCAHYADALARALAKRDDVMLTLYHQFGNWLNEEPGRGTRIEGVGMPFLETEWSEAESFWSAKPVEKLPGSPELVHSGSFQSPWIRGVKSVMTIHDVSFWTVPEYTTEANRLHCQAGVLEGLKRVDGVVFVSKSACDEFEMVFPGWLEKNGVDHAIVLHGNRVTGDAPLPLEERRPFWLAVGSIEPRKNYEMLLDALEIYRTRSENPKPLRIIGGSGWLSESLQRRMREMEKAGIVEWVGYASDEALAMAYREAFGFLCASWYEGFGMPLLEALGNGTPSITSNRTSLPEVGGDVARYVAPDSPESMVEKMLELEADPKSWQSDSARARDWAAKFTWERTADETVAFYRRVLESGRPPRADAAG